MIGDSRIKKITFSDVHRIASGNWERIHRALGVSPASTNHLKHTPCPCCGGRDRFRVTDRYAETGGWICSQGGGETIGGDGFALLQHHGYSASESLAMVARECGIDTDAEIDREELERRRMISEAQAKKAAQIRHNEELKRRKSAIFRTRQYLLHGKPPRHHRYLDAKMLTNAHNALEYKGRLIITMTDINGEITGCQMIFGYREAWDNRLWDVGEKYILSGSQKKGSWHWLQSPPLAGQAIGVCEGWATGASLVEPEIGFDGAVAVAFDDNNMIAVTAILLSAYPDSSIIIFADDDNPKPQIRNGNLVMVSAGIAAAKSAQLLDPARVSIRLPQWAGAKPEWASDFNDLLVIERERDID